MQRQSLSLEAAAQVQVQVQAQVQVLRSALSSALLPAFLLSVSPSVSGLGRPHSMPRAARTAQVAR